MLCYERQARGNTSRSMSMQDVNPIESSLPDSEKRWGSLEDEGLELAGKALEHSHSEYSDTKVGAALFTDKGFYTGTNIEIGGRVGSIHAEMMALFKAISDGASDFPFIVVETEDDDWHIPCSVCQHVMAEFMGDCVLVAGHSEGKESALLSEELGEAWMPGDNR